MSFLTLNDYLMVATEDDVEAINPLMTEGEDPQPDMAQAEATAQEEISGYLRSRYDVDAIFAASGDDRNPVIVMRMADIALYHLAAKLPAKMNFEIRSERYMAAVKWLSDIQKGIINLSLPTIDATDPGNPVKWSSLPKQNMTW